jgi:hypothetical protein
MEQLLRPEILALLIPMLALLIPIVAILVGTLTKHQKDMAEIKARTGNTGTNDEVLKEVKAMRAEMAELRDTTTKFDMSFDAAITRLEQRVDRLEDVNATPQTRVTPAPQEQETVSLRR